MQLRKKNISSKRLSKLEASKRFSFNDYPQAEFVNNKKRPELLQFEETALDQENNIPRKRTFSEGNYKFRFFFRIIFRFFFRVLLTLVFFKVQSKEKNL